MTLVDAVENAIDGMTWLKPSDAGTVALAHKYAKAIDDGDAASLYLGPHLLNALRALGGAPAERKALAGEEAVDGKLAQLRAIRGGKAG